jgi:hypothetical protein
LRIIVSALFAVASLTKRLELRAPPFMAGGVFIVRLEPRRHGGAKDEIHIKLERIDAVSENLFFDRIAMLGQKVRGPVELAEPEILASGGPTRSSQRSWRAIQPLRRHGEKRGFARRLQLLLARVFGALRRSQARPSSP